MVGVAVEVGVVVAVEVDDGTALDETQAPAGITPSATFRTF